MRGWTLQAAWESPREITKRQYVALVTAEMEESPGIGCKGQSRQNTTNSLENLRVINRMGVT